MNNKYDATGKLNLIICRYFFRGFLSWLLCFPVLFLNGQATQDSIQIEYLWEKADETYHQNKYEDSKQFYEAFIQLCDQNEEFLYVLMGEMYFSKILYEQGAIDQLDTRLQKAENYGRKHQVFQQHPEMQGDLDFWKGVLQYARKNYESSIYYLEKVLEIYPDYGDDLMATEYEIYNNLGAAFYELGDYKRAINYYKKSDQVSKSKAAKVIYYQNIGQSLLEEEKIEEAISFFEKSIAYFPEKSKIGLSENKWAISFNSLGDAYTRHGKYKTAAEVLAQAKALEPSSIIQAKNLQELAKLSLALGDFPKAKNLFQQALAQRLELLGAKDQQVGSTFRQIGAAYAQQGEYEEALAYYQKAMVHLVLDFSDSTNYSINPPLKNINSKVYLLQTLSQKAAAQQALQQKENALQTFQLADQLLDTLRIHYLVVEDSKYFWLKKAKDIYEQAIPLALALDKKELAFYFSQKSHGLLLREGIQKMQLAVRSELPDSLKQKERNFKIDITGLELRIFDAKGKDKKVLEEKLFAARYQLERLRKSIKENFPDYFKQSYELPRAKLVAIQEKLKAGEDALVEYFIGEKQLFCFVITKNSFKVYEQEKPEKFSLLISTIRNTLSKNSGSSSAFSNYTKAAYELYQLLFEAVLKDHPGLSNFIIIPDEILGYLPFNIFLSEPAEKLGRYDLLSYLAIDYNFVYNYSSALFVEFDQDKKTNTQKPYVGFAPSFSGSPGSVRNGEKLDSLLYNKYEVLLIDSIVNGQLYTDTTATLQTYLNSLAYYRIAHLSTHANCNDVNPAQSRLHFYDEDISTAEIYNLNLNTELVVLSACETGAGQLRKGEGIMSLARAFMHAGCPSVITSLWKVNDKKTAIVMKYFYQNLYQGKSKNEALGNAQRTYLESVEAASMAHPYYWASFIQLGNFDPLWDAGISFWQITLAVVLFLLVLLLIRSFLTKK